MKYDFDKIHNRLNTNSLKYDFATERGMPKGVMPLWVADMDFKVPESIENALKKRCEHGIFGYTDPKEDYYETLYNWFLSRHGWSTNPHNFTFTCTIVFAICTLLRAVTNVGDAVIITQPVYYPFSESVTSNKRKLIISELVNNNGYYTVDFADFEKKITENNVKAFILCNPHNPVGRVWTKEELARLGDICIKHGVFVISDEIHSDFVYGKNKHTVFETVKKEFADICAVCTAPSKTFNIAGLHISNIYIHNAEIRRKFADELFAQGYSQPNVMGLTACQAAYAYGAEWLDELLVYLQGNMKFLDGYIKSNLPQIGFTSPEGTYLAWLDMRSLGLSDKELKSFMANKAGLWLDDGFIFGKGGSGFQRINAACPRSVLAAAMDKLSNAIAALK